MVKRLILFLALTLAIFFAGACDDNPTCTQCGFQPGEHIMTSYVDSSGASIYVSGYADASGCFTAVNCQ